MMMIIFVVVRGKVLHPWAREVASERSSAAGETFSGERSSTGETAGQFSDLQLRALKG